MTERRTLAYDSFEVHLAANFFLQVQLFLRELVRQISDLLVCERVLHSNGQLIRNLNKELDVVVIESVFLAACDRQNSKQTALAHQWHVAERVQAFSSCFRVHLRRYLSGVKTIHNDRLPALKRIPRHSAINRNQRS